MGLILPAAAIFAVAIGVAWLLGGGKGGAEALGRAVRRGGAGALIVLGAFLALTGRIGIGLMLLGFGLSVFRPQFSLFGSGGSLFGPRLQVGRDPHGRERIRVKGGGRLNGRLLDDLSPQELFGLLAVFGRSPRERSILEAYLDRRLPFWREDIQRDAAGRTGRPARPGAMTDEQAHKILGLAPGAGEAEIRAAYRRLMKSVHPDQGGSTFLAAQINEAKDRLLGKHR